MMNLLKTLVALICQGLLFVLAMGVAGLAAHFGGGLIAYAFAIDEVIPSIVIFFAVVTAIGFVGNRIWPDGWLANPMF